MLLNLSEEILTIVLDYKTSPILPTLVRTW